MERYHILKLGLAILFYCMRPLMVDGLNLEASTHNQTRTFDENDFVYYQGVQGKPGVDFPVLSHIPRTTFSCRSVDSGYYADLETDCQVFHICEDGRKISFLCPNGTIFQQSELICEWWFKVNCSDAPNLYEESAEQLREENARRKAARRRQYHHGAVMRTEEHASVTAVQNGRNLVATKRVFNENNDLAKASSSDLVRGRGSTTRKPAEFANQGRKQQQFAGGTNNQRFQFDGQRKQQFREEPTTTTRKQSRKFVDSSTSPSVPQSTFIITRSTTVKPRTNKQQAPTYYINFTNDFASGTTKSSGSSYRNDNNFVGRNREEQRTTKGLGFESSTTTVPSTTVTTSYRQDRKLSFSNGKEGTIKQQSSVPPTRNDIDSTRSESSDSDEAQITQETASFYKNSYNSIDQEPKYTTSNPHPNHRETYSDLKEPKYYSTKIFSAISSVTPQYLTTQSINNGRPFVGSQVGTHYFSTSTTAPPSTSTTSGLEQVFNFNTGKTAVASTASSFTSPRGESSTNRVLDHATVYGKFSKTPPTKSTILLSKSLFNSGTTAAPVRSSTTVPVSTTARSTFSSTPARTTILLSKSLFDSTTSSSFYLPTAKPSSAEILTAADSYNRAVPQVRFFGKVQSSTKTPATGLNSLSSTSKPPVTTPFGSTLPQTMNSLSTTFGTTPKPGFFVTKGTLDEIVRPRPFQLPPEPDFRGRAVYSTTTEKSETSPFATFPTYKISSASPFSGPSTPEPTQPTPFTTARPTLASTFESVDSMITALAELATQNASRPGLVVPPSVGPQTLHTLAVYFANALDGIAADKKDDHEDEDTEQNEEDLEKKRVTELLTEMTMNRYNELFNEEKPTIASRAKSEDDDLEGQHSKGLVGEPPKVRQLAKVFTQALSSYLDDPATFKKVLEEIRPTEPPEESTDLGDDELLNFSDADSKSSYPPFFPTPPAARPTWGYLIAYNTSQNLDVKNSITPDLENLQGADSQSFVSQFNKLREVTTRSSLLPEDHWTSSPDVTKLWNSAFSFNPASINDNFGPTEPTVTEVKYELRALPQLDLNSTQVHGILIDFMNTTKSEEDSRLQRILRKLNTTEDEFLAKMKEIESNPLTRRLVLLLINECGSNTTQEAASVQVRSSLQDEILETASSGRLAEDRKSSSGFQIVDPSLADDNQDTRALQLLNSLYTIASKFGK